MELLEQEIKVLKQIENEFVIRLLEILKSKNNIYLVTEYCNGTDMANYLRLKKRISEEEAVYILQQVIRGFYHIRQKNVIHRDFKLANILIHNNQIKIADFGFAKVLESSSQTGTSLGTPVTMAPEVLEEKQYTSKADIWSIGVVFY